MILQIDHVAASSLDIEADGKRLEMLGYHKVFASMGLDNPLIKKGLMARYSAKHDAALYSFPGKLSIELINHGHANEAEGYIRPIHGDSGGFDAIEVETADIRAGAAFWKLLGFRETQKESENNGAVLEFQPVFPGPKCTMVLRETHGPRPHFVDDKGYNCLAFVSNSVMKEKEALESAGIKTTGVEMFMSNGRQLEIMFASGPSGEIVEIIGLRAKAKR